MQCELCNNNEASHHFVQVEDGEAREIHICNQCAEKQGLKLVAEQMVQGLMALKSKTNEPQVKEEGLKCGFCGTRESAFKTDSRLGCSECYSVFDSELSEIIPAIQRGEKHVGKIPARYKKSNDTRDLDEALRSAVAKQDFEEAARLRDLINTKNKPENP